MANAKKIIILNGISNNFNGKGIVKFEAFDDHCLARVEILSSCNVEAKNLTLLIGVDGKILSITVEKKAIFEAKFNKKCSLNDGICALIKGDSTPILYGESENSILKLKDLITQKTCKNNDDFIYDDEQIAIENYYENIKTKPVLPNKNDGEFDCCKEEKEHLQKEIYFSENEEATRPFKSQEFYLKNKDKLDEIFKNFQPFNCFDGIIPSSQFAMVNYNENSHYVVGIIKENNAVKYVCYGVPNKREEPPKNIEKYCKFIPTSLDLNSGYFLVFQCADSGKIV